MHNSNIRPTVGPSDWDAFLEAEMAGIPVDDGLRKGRLAVALKQKHGIRPEISRTIVEDYYRRHHIVDPPVSRRWKTTYYVNASAALLFIPLIVLAVFVYLQPVHNAHWERLMITCGACLLFASLGLLGKWMR